MLLEDKIDQILAGELEYIDLSSDILISELELKGLVNTKTMTTIDIIYYLLNLNFPYDNINIELYKRLQHLLDSNIPIQTSNNVNYVEPIIVPTIITSVQDLDFGLVRIGGEKVLSFTFEASSTYNSIVISTNPEFLISNDPVDGFTTELLYLPTAITGALSTTRVYVKYIPVNIGADTTVLNIDITGVSTTTVNLIGEGINSTLYVAPITLAFGSISINTDSVPQYITITGSNLESNVVVQAPTGYLISETQIGGYTTSIIIPLEIDNSVNKVIWVLFHPLIVGSITGNINVSNTEITGLTVALSGTGQNALLTVTDVSFDFGNVAVGYPSEILNTTVSGINLLADIVITANSMFQISINQVTWSTVLYLTPTSGVVSDTVIYCKFVPDLSIPYSFSISVSSTAATTTNINSIGTGFISNINTDISSLAFGNITLDYDSAYDFFHLAGDSLTGDVTLTASSGYTLSVNNAGGPYTSSAIITPTLGIVDDNIYVIFSPILEQSYPGTITIENDFINPIAVSLSGNGVVAVLARTPSTLSFPDTEVTQESVDSFDLSGDYLMQDVVVTAPTGFQVSKTMVGGYATSISYNPSLINAGETVYVKFIPALVQVYSGNVVSTSNPDATPISVAVDGEGINASVPVTLARPGNTKLSYPSGITLTKQQFPNSVSATSITFINIFCAASIGSQINCDIYRDSDNTLLGTSLCFTTDGSGSDKTFVISGGSIAVTPGELLRLELYRNGGGTLDFVALSNNADILLAYNAIQDSVSQAHPIDIDITGTT